MLRVILNRLVNQAEQIFDEEQTGFRPQGSNYYCTDIQLKAEDGKVLGTSKETASNARKRSIEFGMMDSGDS